MRNKNEAIKQIVLGEARKRNLSLRKVAAGTGISSSYLSQILNGRNPLKPGILNTLADFFGLQRVVLYAAAGWIAPDKEELLVLRVREQMSKDPEFADFLRKFLAAQDTRCTLVTRLARPLATDAN